MAKVVAYICLASKFFHTKENLFMGAAKGDAKFTFQMEALMKVRPLVPIGSTFRVDKVGSSIEYHSVDRCQSFYMKR